jgi:hypothetical protein
MGYKHLWMLKSNFQTGAQNLHFAEDLKVG